MRRHYSSLLDEAEMITMKRTKKIILWCVGVVAVLIIGGAVVANYAIDKVLSSMSGIGDISPIEIADNSEPNPNDIESDIDSEIGSDTGSDTGSDVISTEPPTEGQNGSANAIPDATVSKDVESGKATTTPGKSSSKDTEQVASNSGNNNSAGQALESDDVGTYSAAVSQEKAAAIQDSVTLKEKAKVASVLLGSLSASDISTLQQLASGGLSVEEKKEARKILLEKLSEDEYDSLIVIAAKYGVSQGKSYSEVKDK